MLLEDLINPEFPFYVNLRRDDGGHNFRITTGKNIIKHIPALYYFVHVLIDRLNSEVDKPYAAYLKDLVKMYSRDIEPFRSKNDFKFIWSILRYLKIIEDFSNNEPTIYKKSAMAYYFKFKEPYHSAAIVEHQIKVKKSIADKLNKKWGVRDQQIDLASIKTNILIAHQYQSLHNINFDSSSARIYIEQQLADGLMSSDKHKACVITIYRICNHRLRVSHSVKCNRYYTPVTSMPKEMRQFIKDIDGNSLIELDFGSFNAFAVYKIVNTICYDEQSNIDKVLFENEINLYRELLLGDFYADIKKMCFNKNDFTRDEVKDIVLHRWMNGRVNSRNKYKKVLDQRFPKISEILTAIKSKDYPNFSNSTMKLESELVNEIIYKKFVEMHPNAIML